MHHRKLDLISMEETFGFHTNKHFSNYRKKNFDKMFQTNEKVKKRTCNGSVLQIEKDSFSAMMFGSK